MKPSANGRCEQIGHDERFLGVTNPFPWMAEMIDLKKEKTFFGRRSGSRTSGSRGQEHRNQVLH